uniref:Hydrolase, alpha/beta fold family n=1 Tax=uncultured marine group II/III euryarchaeote KM3_170_G02 TaxID=1457927 RepID=A0A075GPV2_9EURY|nr:hydrolase, alpha/beta fold family [uncultured marine group II/III euryarchaeote KM3_170_G02]
MLRRLVLTVALLLSSLPQLVAAEAELVGSWHGELNLVVQKLRIGMKFNLNRDGTFRGVLDSIDQNAFGIPLTTIERAGKQLRVEVESLGVVYTAQFSADGNQLAGTFKQNGIPLSLTLSRVDRYPSLNRPQEPRGPLPYDEEDVSYRSPLHDLTLAGTLTIPRSSRPLAAVLLITGSGSQDRDESIAGHRPFLVIADALSRRGIAVLRVDDRGVGGSSAGATPATSVDLADDVLAGVKYLAARPEIDAARIGLIGHSEGGLIAPMVAARSDQVSMIVMLAGPGVPGTQILLTQGRLIGEAMKRPEWFLDWNQMVQRELFDAIAELPDPAASREKIAGMIDDWIARVPEQHAVTRDTLRTDLNRQLEMFNSPWFRYFLFHDPDPVLRRVPCPVLALFGERDLQVPAEENSAAVARALAAGRNRYATIATLDELNHLFQTCETGSPLEYSTIAETMNPAALEFMVDWVVQRSGSGQVRLAQRRRLRRRQARLPEAADETAGGGLPE